MQEYETITTVRIADIEMGFGSMVRFMVKWAFAAIPAIIIIFIICFIIGLFFTLIGVGLTGAIPNVH
jgi:hypothetical protein